MLGNIVNLMSKYKNISCSYSIFNVVKLSFYELDLFSIASLTLTENCFFLRHASILAICGRLVGMKQNIFWY